MMENDEIPEQHQTMQPGREAQMAPQPKSTSTDYKTGQVLHPNGGNVVNG